MSDSLLVVADNGPLIALATVGHLELLNALYGSVLVPQAVVREVVHAGRDRPGARELAGAAWAQQVELDTPPDPYLVMRSSR